MRDKKEIEKQLKKYEGIERFNYDQNPRPFGEWMKQRDLGYRDALRWVLEVEDNPDLLTKEN